MDSMKELLASLSSEDLAKLKGAAEGLLGSREENMQTEKQTPSGPLSGDGGDIAEAVLRVAEQMNREDDRTRFLAALRPLLSEERRKKADEAVKFLKLMELIPLLKGLVRL